MGRDFLENIYVSEEEILELLIELQEGDPEAASDFFARFNFGPLCHNGMFYET